MSDERQYSHRELILARRAACRSTLLSHTSIGRDEADLIAERRYPFPKITRPRVVGGVMRGHDAFTYRVVDGVLSYSSYGGPWTSLGTQAQFDDHCARIKSLFLRPTEDVEDTGE